MNTEFFEALSLLEREKGIPADYLLEKISNAIVIAVKRDHAGVENVLVDANEILLENAIQYDKKAQVGSVVNIPLETKQFGRIAAQTAKHVIRQGIREAERGQMLQEFQNKEQEIVTAIVQRIDQRRGTATLEIGRNEAVLPNPSRCRERNFTKETGSRFTWWKWPIPTEAPGS